MRLIVELDDEFYNHIQNDHEYFLEDGEELYSIVQNATPIPDNVTHGEAMQIGLKALFPKTVFIVDERTYEGSKIMAFSDEWWNAKYPVYEESEE